MITEEQILETLKAVVDPEIGLNIVDLGLVYKVDISETNLKVTMTLTTPGCPMHDSITNWAQTILKKKCPEKIVEIDLVWEPQWTPELMSEEARKQLNI